MPRLAAINFFLLRSAGAVAGLVVAACTGPAPARSVPTQWAADSTTVLRAAGPAYARGAVWGFFWGPHYRDIWATPVTVPVFHVATSVPGGLVPVQAGGSYQSRTLRLRAAGGNEYVLRSVDKNAGAALPAGWKRRLLGGLMKDQTSVAQPYGAYVAAQLAEAAGVLHTNPRLVYLADDPALGQFRKAYANDLYLLEERPDGNQKGAASFGHSPLVVNTARMLAAIHQNPRQQVMARAYLRARLLDMWLGDWSRREDQWRWASFAHAGHVSYRPIPRDRDQAFFLFDDGAVTRVVSWFVKKYQSFHARISPRAVDGLTRTARTLDLTLLGRLNADDFRQVADSLRLQLSDAAIARALAAGPPETRALIAARLGPLLKARRDQLPAVANHYYKLLARNAWLVGTDQPERFVLSDAGPGNTRVQMFALRPQQPDSLLVERVYDGEHTAQLTLYSLAGNDVFEVQAPPPSAIRVHVHGGDGDNQLLPTKLAPATGSNIIWHSLSPVAPRREGSSGVRRQLDADSAQTANSRGWLKRFSLPD